MGPRMYVYGDLQCFELFVDIQADILDFLFCRIRNQHKSPVCLLLTLLDPRGRRILIMKVTG